MTIQLAGTELQSEKITTSFEFKSQIFYELPLIYFLVLNRRAYPHYHYLIERNEYGVFSREDRELMDSY
jgi:hypothetical protein